MLLIGSTGVSTGVGREGPGARGGKCDGEMTVVIRVHRVVRNHRGESVRRAASSTGGSRAHNSRTRSSGVCEAGSKVAVANGGAVRTTNDSAGNPVWR